MGVNIVVLCLISSIGDSISQSDLFWDTLLHPDNPSLALFKGDLKTNCPWTYSKGSNAIEWMIAKDPIVPINAENHYDDIVAEF